MLCQNNYYRIFLYEMGVSTPSGDRSVHDTHKLPVVFFAFLFLTVVVTSTSTDKLKANKLQLKIEKPVMAVQPLKMLGIIPTAAKEEDGFDSISTSTEPFEKIITSVIKKLKKSCENTKNEIEDMDTFCGVRDHSDSTNMMQKHQTRRHNDFTTNDPLNFRHASTMDQSILYVLILLVYISLTSAVWTWLHDFMNTKHSVQVYWRNLTSKRQVVPVSVVLLLALYDLGSACV